MTILERVLKTLGISDEEIEQALTGPAAPPRKALPDGVPRFLGAAAPTRASLPSSLVYLLLDTSDSMEEEDKLSQARRGGRKFAADAIAKGYAVGVIRFSDEAEVTAEPSKSVVAVEKGLAAFCEGSTNMATAIRLAAERLGSGGCDRAIVLVTDGFPDDQAEALAAAENAKRRGITIITIGTDDADRDFLARIASVKGLSRKVTRQELHVAIADSARLLPAKTK